MFLTVRAFSRIFKIFDIRELLGGRAEIVSTVCVSMSSRGVSTAEEGGNWAGRGKASSGRFGKAVNEPVGSPVKSGEQLAVALLGDTDSN